MITKPKTKAIQMHSEYWDIVIKNKIENCDSVLFAKELALKSLQTFMDYLPSVYAVEGDNLLPTCREYWIEVKSHLEKISYTND